MVIGVVREIKNNEFRVGLTPGAVSAFVQAGHQVLVERGACLGSGFPDEEYAQAGAEFRDGAAPVWAEAQLIVNPSLLNIPCSAGIRSFSPISTWRQSPP